MLATIMPFICMGAGLAAGLQPLPHKFYKVADWIMTVSMMVLMMTIGGNVGTSEEVVGKLGTVGFNCIVTCLSAIAGSVVLCLMVEKTVLPLDQFYELTQGRADAAAEERSSAAENDAAAKENDSEKDGSSPEKKKTDPILVMIPVCLLGGAFGCYFFMPKSAEGLLDITLWASLVVLYTSVGLSMGKNRNVFGYMKKIGFRILYLIAAIWFGSIAGGALSVLITGMPLKYAVISASGAGYYSMTGATMLSWFGTEAGVYGFMVNVFRDFFTVLLLPLLAKVGKSAPIAAGAGGNMDSMLVPVTRTVGDEMSLVVLVTGIALTFGVPVMLPVLCSLLG